MILMVRFLLDWGRIRAPSVYRPRTIRITSTYHPHTIHCTIRVIMYHCTIHVPSMYRLQTGWNKSGCVVCGMRLVTSISSMNHDHPASLQDAKMDVYGT